MNKQQEAIAKLQQKIEPSNGRWVLLAGALGNFCFMISTESQFVGDITNMFASACLVGFLAVNLQAIFIKPILEILQDSFEDENDE
jgi:hypothetical protein